MDVEGKTTAFRLFDFENSSSWKAYLQRFDISGSGYNEKLLKLKAKWYKREVDADFDLAWLATHGTTGMNASPHCKSETAREASQSGGTASTGTAASVPPPAIQAPFFHVLLHFVVMGLGAMSVIPLCPPSISKIFLQLVFLTGLLKTIQRFGRPKIFPLSGLKLWLGRALGTTEAQYGFMALLFFRQLPTRIICIPATVLAAYHSFTYLNSKLSNHSLWRRYGSPVFKYMAMHQNRALLLNAMCEIGTGFLLIIQTFMQPRQLLLSLVMYWQWLRMRYWCQDAATIQRQAWNNVGQMTEPLVRAVPFLNYPISFAKKWFTQLAR